MLYLLCTALATLLSATLLAIYHPGTAFAFLSLLPIAAALLWLTLDGSPPRETGTGTGTRLAPGFDPQRADTAGVQAAMIVESGRIANVNRAMLKAMNLDGRSDQLIGMPLANIVHPKHQKRLNAMLEGTGTDAGMVSFLRPDGLPWLASLRIETGAAPPALLLQLTPLDAEPESPMDHRWLHCLAQSSRDVLFATDEERNLVYVNPQWQAVMGRPLQAVLGAPLLSMFHLADRPALLNGLRQLSSRSASGFTCDARTMPSTPNALRWVEVRMWRIDAAIPDQEGIAGIMVDITARKLAEQSLRAQGRNLHRMIDNLPCTVYRCQPNREFFLEYISEGCFDITGYTAAELLEGTGASMTALIHPEDQEFVWNAVETRLARHDRYELKYRMVGKDGRTRWVFNQGRGIYSNQRELLGLEGVLSESSRRGREEDARQRLIYERVTGLANPALFAEHLRHLYAHARIAGYEVAVVVVEIASLQLIAAHHGTAISDRTMVELGKRLWPLQNASNLAARTGKAHFCIVLADLTPAAIDWSAGAEPASLAHAVAGVLSQPLRIDGHPVPLEVTIAEACDIKDYSSIETLLALAGKRG